MGKYEVIFDSKEWDNMTVHAYVTVMVYFFSFFPSSFHKRKGSVPPLGAMFGSMCAFPMLHYFGRKYTLLLASPLWTAAWIFIGTAVDWKIVIVGRILSGFCIGLCLPSAQIYVGTIENTAIFLFSSLYILLPNVYSLALAGNWKCRSENSRRSGIIAVHFHVCRYSIFVYYWKRLSMGHGGMDLFVLHRLTKILHVVPQTFHSTNFACSIFSGLEYCHLLSARLTGLVAQQNAF